MRSLDRILTQTRSRESTAAQLFLVLDVVTAAIFILASRLSPAFVPLIFKVSATAYLARLVAFLFWFHRAYDNLRPLRVNNLANSSNWAFLSFLTPVVNLFTPYVITCEIWKASTERLDFAEWMGWKKEPVPPLLGYWWTLRVSAFGFTLFAFLTWYSHFVRLSMVATFWATALALGAFANLLAIKMIALVDERQERRARALSEYDAQRAKSRPQPAAPQPAPGPGAPRPSPVATARPPAAYAAFRSAVRAGMDPQRAFHAFFLYAFLYVVLSLVNGSPLGVLFGRILSANLVLLSSPLIALLTCWVILKIDGKPFSLITSAESIGPAAAISLPILGLGLAATSRTLVLVLPRTGAGFSLYLDSAQSGFLTLVTIAVLAPVLEELLFRGLVLGALLSEWSVPASIVVSSLLFALHYPDPAHIAAGFVLGLGCGLARVATGSVWAAVLLHACHNLAAYCLDSMNGPSLWSASWGLLLIAIGVYLLAVRAGNVPPPADVVASLRRPQASRPGGGPEPTNDLGGCP